MNVFNNGFADMFPPKLPNAAAAAANELSGFCAPNADRTCGGLLIVSLSIVSFSFFVSLSSHWTSISGHSLSSSLCRDNGDDDATELTDVRLLFVGELSCSSVSRTL